jgi:hypothetical protein
MLKNPPSFVLASLGASTYRKGTPQFLVRCGRAGWAFEHPALYAAVSTLMRMQPLRKDINCGSFN